MAKVEYDYSKLRGRVYEKFGTVTSFAKQAGFTGPQISSLFGGRHNLSQESIERVAVALEIPLEDYGAYFFARKDAETLP